MLVRQVKNLTPRLSRQIHHSVKAAIESNGMPGRRPPYGQIFGVVFISPVVFTSGYILYNSYVKDEPTFLPFWFHRKYDLVRENAFDVDVEKLEKKVHSRLIDGLSRSQTFQSEVGTPLVQSQSFKFQLICKLPTIRGVKINFSRKGPLWQDVYKDVSVTVDSFLEPLGGSVDSNVKCTEKGDLAMKDHRVEFQGQMLLGGSTSVECSGVIDRQVVVEQASLIVLRDGKKVLKRLW